MNSYQQPPPGSVPPIITPAPEKPRWHWWIHLCLVGSYPLVLGLLGWSRSAHHGAPALSHTARGLLVVSGLELLVFGAVFGLGWLASRASRDELLLRWRPGWWVVPLGVGYSVALRLALLVLAVLVSVVLVVTNVVNLDQLQHTAKANQPDVSALVDISALTHNPLYWWLSLTLVSFVVAGLREELWRTGFLAGLRALWPGAFGSTRGQLVGVCVAAVIFGLGHLAMGPLASVMAGILGLGLGAIMVLHRSIWPAVIAHGMFDATTFAFLPLIADLMRHSH
jgi:membrane protease YdiL (CAAX protease family)